MLEMVRAELGTDLGEELIVPMVNDGTQLHKIFGLMHDTRSTANRVAVLMAELRERKARSFHGDAAWDAADPCEPVVRDPMTGHFVVPHNVKVPDSNVTITRALQGYCLAEYPNGIDANPTYFPWVQQYSDHFRTVIQPKHPSLFLASPANEASPNTSKDLPSSTRTPKRRTRPQAHTRRNVREKAAASN